MKRLTVTLALCGTLGWAGCDLLDPSNVENPNITEDVFLGQSGPVTPLIIGLERQLGIALNGYVTPAEVASDNYVNTQTFFNQNFDRLNINPSDNDINATYFGFSRLRALAQFGKNTVFAADSLATNDQLAEIHFYEGLASLYLGEIFTTSPDSAASAVVPPAQLIERAIGSFQRALSLTASAGARTGYQIALARAYRNSGDKANARTAATTALTGMATFTRTVRYDATNGPVSTIQDALFDRGSFDDLQPLPRLDFLDPKFYSPGAAADAPFPYVKAEEAHLILIEADLSDGNLASAQTRMNALIALVGTRPRPALNDNVEGRQQTCPAARPLADPRCRPNTSDFRVRASAADSFRSGLVVTRNGVGVTVPVPTISGTSVTPAIVASLTSVDQAAEVLYLMRQEIFIAEGRRLMDLGIRLPLPVNETTANPNLGLTAEQNTPTIPAFLPPGAEFDAYTADGAARTVTITHNLNRILAQNRTNAALQGFF